MVLLLSLEEDLLSWWKTPQKQGVFTHFWISYERSTSSWYKNHHKKKHFCMSFDLFQKGILQSEAIIPLKTSTLYNFLFYQKRVDLFHEEQNPLIYGVFSLEKRKIHFFMKKKHHKIRCFDPLKEKLSSKWSRRVQQLPRKRKKTSGFLA